MIVNSPRVGPVAQVVCHELHMLEAFLLRAFFAKQNIIYKLETLISYLPGIASRAFEQALRADRPPPGLSFATTDSLPATQGQCSKDRAAPLRDLCGALVNT